MLIEISLVHPGETTVMQQGFTLGMVECGALPRPSDIVFIRGMDSDGVLNLRRSEHVVKGIFLDVSDSIPGKYGLWRVIVAPKDLTP